MKKDLVARFCLTLPTVLVFACAAGQSGPPERDVPLATPAKAPDIVATALDFNVPTRKATAIIDFAELTGAATSITLEKGDLQIDGVIDASGPLDWKARGTDLDIGIPAGTRQVRVDYHYNLHSGDKGALLTGSTRIWPDHCGNLFPCNSDPADGTKFHLALSGLSVDQVGVYPQRIATEAPPYMMAWAVGEYEYTELGKTDAGTEVGIYYEKKNQNAIRSGTYRLVRAFNWFEQTLGPYAFGDKVASVAVDWGLEHSNKAMEYHPYWHVAPALLANQMVHIHEAAHGWFGNGIRIKCWEDLVLSEGVVTYLTARALEQAAGRYYANREWRDLRRQISKKTAWPQGCNETKVEDFNSPSLYARGAFFMNSVEVAVGREELDKALKSFYEKYKGKAARFDDLLTHIEAETKKDMRACAESWLRNESVPSGNFESCSL